MSLVKKLLSLDPRKGCRTFMPKLICQSLSSSQSPGWQDWVLNFKMTFTPPFPNDRPLPLACSETSTKVVLGAPMVIALTYTHLVTPSPGPSRLSSFLFGWHLTKLSSLRPFSYNISQFIIFSLST